MDDWRPSASLRILRERAALLAAVRSFFHRRGVLEVDTPLLAAHTVSDPALRPLVVATSAASTQPRYLQTSPEYAMKRLLAAGSGPIYQICHAFRDEEQGRRHNPEFTLLEWYRPGFDLQALMAEVAELILPLLGRARSHCYRYREIFFEVLAIDPFTATDRELAGAARRCADIGGIDGDRDLWLDLLMSHAVEPALAGRGVVLFTIIPPARRRLRASSALTGSMSRRASSCSSTAWSWPTASMNWPMPASRRGALSATIARAGHRACLSTGRTPGCLRRWRTGCPTAAGSRSAWTGC